MGGVHVLSCPACGGDQLAKVMDHPDFDGAAIFRCGDCGHGITAPEPDVADLARHYVEIYAPRRARWLGADFQATMVTRAAAQWAFVAAGLNLAGKGGGAGWRVIDLGCGIGALTAHAAGQGACASGYDSDHHAIAFGREVFPAACLHVGDPPPSASGCDLLLLSHVVEHLPQVELSVTAMLSLLRPGGFVFIEVPNVPARLFEAGAETESHLQFFSLRSLTLLLGRLGLEVMICRSCGPEIEDFLAVPTGDSFRSLYEAHATRYDPLSGGSGIWLRALARKPLQGGERR
ncbi:MAG: class I SAM-dependent methyltransferase [Magnetospirillum gryphiswaldense]|nr:class I SAM-dependent methyltransferase [Magnetospirillum gryphiswaldense]